MGEEDTIILSPDEKERILKEIPEEESETEEDENSQFSTFAGKAGLTTVSPAVLECPSP